MSDTTAPITCADCGGEYTWEEESAADHEEDCPVRKAKIRLGEWAPPEEE